MKMLRRLEVGAALAAALSGCGDDGSGDGSGGTVVTVDDRKGTTYMSTNVTGQTWSRDHR